MRSEDLAALQAIVLNLHWNYSGVTTTSRTIAPLIAKHLQLAWLGPNPPEGVQQLKFYDLLRLRTRKKVLIWHARRNNEALIGLLLKILGWPFKLIFTSAGQRKRTLLTHFIIKHMDEIIATSQTSASFVERKSHVINHGVDAALYAPAPDRSAEFAKMGLPGRYAIGCFGRVRAQKGTDLFVEAMLKLLPRYPDFTAVIIGAVTNNQKDFLEILKQKINAAQLEKRIVILGELPIEQVIHWYKCISIYAFTSRNEGYGLTLLEAMAAGVALVATRAGAAELVIKDGDTGVLVPTGDAYQLAQAIEPLMADPLAAAAMGARARLSVMQNFSLDNEVTQIAQVYQSLL